MDFRAVTQTAASEENGVIRNDGSYPERYLRSSRRRNGSSAAATAELGISANNILNSLSPEVRRVIEPALKPVMLTKEQFLFQEGDHLDFLYFPISAVVSEFKILEDGRMVEIAVTGREGAIGLSSLLSESHVAPNCTQVSQAGSAMKLDAETFEKLLRTNESLRLTLSRFMDQYIRQISQKAICNMYHSVKE